MKKHSKQLLKISLATFSILALLPILSSNADIGQALAQVTDSSYNISSNSLTRVMCNALRLVTGSAGKTFAAFAIIATGIGFFTGKVSWGLMIGVTAGIATMFGAPSIVAAISGQDTSMSCGVN
jgi:type IV secretory pathway VirB2 component (pilin)